jgi:hypothetical protein
MGDDVPIRPLHAAAGVHTSWLMTLDCPAACAHCTQVRMEAKAVQVTPSLAATAGDQRGLTAQALTQVDSAQIAECYRRAFTLCISDQRCALVLPHVPA